MSESHRRPVGLTEAAERRLRRTANFAVVVIAISAAVLSFNGLRNLALDSGIPTELAWLFPIVVDGLTLVGSMGVVHASLSGLSTWYPWALTLIGVGMSVWGNVASAPPVWKSQAVHAIPPLVLALALEALLKVYRYRAAAEYIDSVATTPAGHEAATNALSHLPVPGETPSWIPADTAIQPLVMPATTPDTPHLVHTVPERQGPAAPASGRGRTTRELLVELVAKDPDITAAEAARILDKDRSNVGKILKEVKQAAQG